jgi:hypothetical protein
MSDLSADAHESIIDRDAERELFTSMLALRDSTRLLTIRAESGQGKSRLLDWFEYECEWIHELPVSLTDLKQLDDKTHFGLTQHIADRIRESGDVALPNFERLKLALSERDASAFRDDDDAPGQVLTEGVTQRGGVMANRVRDVYQAQELTVVSPKRTWTGGLEEIARDRCVAAFLQDLRAFASERSLVVMIDSYEILADRPALARWIETRLLRRQALDLENVTKLIVVLAGQRIPDFKTGLGDRYSTLVRSVESLGRWDDEHIRRFLEKHGVEASEDRIAYLRQRLKEGWTVQNALMWVELERGFRN